MTAKCTRSGLPEGKQATMCEGLSSKDFLNNYIDI